MDILIRNIEPMYVKEIEKNAEELSEKLSKKISRNEYIKMLIQNDCELKLTKLKEEKFDQAVQLLTATLDRQSDTLQNYIDSNSKLFQLMASGEYIG